MEMAITPEQEELQRKAKEYQQQQQEQVWLAGLATGWDQGWGCSAFTRISVEHKLKSVVDDDHFCERKKMLVDWLAG